jgi:CheY-like chemotaxis protein
MQRFGSVLIVDDDYASNYLTEIILEDLSIATHINVTRNGREALNFIKDSCLDKTTYCPELILLDINMPIMDGFEFLEEFEKLPYIQSNPIPVLLLTTSTNLKDVEKAKKFKVTGYIEKPLTEEKLMEMLKNIVKKS